MKIVKMAAAAYERAEANNLSTLAAKIQVRRQSLSNSVTGIAQRMRMISIKKVLYGTIALCLLISGAFAAYIYDQGFGYAIMVDDEEIAFLYEQDREVVEIFIEELTAEAAMNYDSQVVKNEKVAFVRERRPGEHWEADRVQDELYQLLSFSVYGYTLFVNGMETLVLASEEDHTEVVNIIKNSFIDNNGATLRRFVIQEDINFVRTLVMPEAITGVEEAAELLINGNNSHRETYLVSRGDSLYTIARNQNISLSELQQANPQVTGTTIRPGDELNLVLQVPLVNVSVVEEITVREKIPFETQHINDSSKYTSYSEVTKAGAVGEKEVTYLLTKENGVEIERRVVHEQMIKDPVTQVVVRGTKRQPYEGTGRFVWPLPNGRGTLTSPFGWRWGSMHNGIDIAAPSGTAIRAADSGVVATSTYSSSYGNLVIINHSNGYSTYYAHNSRNMVKVGQSVSKGQTIALVGSTGNSTGPHVHFEIRRNGTPKNPLNFYLR